MGHRTRLRYNFLVRTSLLRTTLLLAALTVLWGCGGSPGAGEGVRRTYYRFIAEDPQGPPPREDLFTEATAFERRFDGRGECLPIWPTEGAATHLEMGDWSLPLEHMEERVRVTMDWPDSSPGPLALEGVDRLDVELVSRHPTSTRAGDVAVYWAAPGEKLDNKRSLLEGHGELGPEGRRRYRLAVGVQAGWTGEPRRLRLIFVPPVTGEPVSLCAIRGIDETLRAEGVEAWLYTGWKGTVGGQIRNALPALVGLPVERVVRIPEGAELRFAYGAPGGVQGDLEFEVWAGLPESTRERLASWRLSARTGRDTWNEAVVDLGPLAGREVGLSLELVAASELDPARGLPLWGNPEIVAPGRSR